ncbi:polysaccharide biosynthesis protein [Jeotgalibacillus soli]|uniref:UDP-N-acetylglucosamine 4,6-dehydratase n=1 Tax=Jeotgalibacillus soli TaxID=889306 RepID=A0A0C2S6Z0_9BACL|nr:nucleoside-diphosphate sugar epimerase/dehydratase [Jeotgalibacillus soli]KIL49804.1 UDP-N-acetylglucosamine 4,6-dehydratase [Jeotgalibacillus soli]
MTYKKRIALLVLIDSLIVLTSIFFSYYLLIPASNPFSLVLIVSSIILLLSHHFFAYRYSIYKRVWQYSSMSELTAIIKAVTFSVAIAAIAQFVIIGTFYTRTLIITWMLHILLIGGSRFAWRMYRDTYIKPNPNQKRALIIGAGAAGTSVVRELRQKQSSELQPVGFIDDDFTKHNLEVMNIPVLGGVKHIESIVKENQIEHIIIAIPSLSKKELQRIYSECAKTSAKTKILPFLEDIMTGRLEVSQIREVQVEDLLGRDPVELDMASISEKLKSKTILVTGAGGSIGSEICRQVCKFKPERLVLLGHGENSIYTIDMELRKLYAQEIDIIPIIADVQDRKRIFDVVSEYRPSVIYHAAAHKHVPLMEINPMEAVKNNIFGTKNVAEAAHEFSVKNFVLVSTDKAVNPPNVMGATKRFAEMIIQNLAKKSETKFAAVRFGNVLGSRGSVIPLFKKQIEAGGPVTVTHPDMTRYFMTIPEASRLVIQAGALASGGEVFVLDMGEPVKIVDLAKNVIRLSGYTEDEIKINFSGIRPGEKLFEELLNEDEIQSEKVFPKIYVGKATPISQYELDFTIGKLLAMNNIEMVDTLIGVANRKIVGSLVVGQRSS